MKNFILIVLLSVFAQALEKHKIAPDSVKNGNFMVSRFWIVVLSISLGLMVRSFMEFLELPMMKIVIFYMPSMIEGDFIV